MTTQITCLYVKCSARKGPVCRCDAKSARMSAALAATAADVREQPANEPLSRDEYIYRLKPPTMVGLPVHEVFFLTHQDALHGHLSFSRSGPATRATHSCQDAITHHNRAFNSDPPTRAGLALCVDATQVPPVASPTPPVPRHCHLPCYEWSDVRDGHPHITAVLDASARWTEAKRAASVTLASTHQPKRARSAAINEAQRQSSAARDAFTDRLRKLNTGCLLPLYQHLSAISIEYPATSTAAATVQSYAAASSADT